MPQAKKPTASRSRPRTFKEPAALKRLSKSLDAAHEAIGELRKDTGRDVGQGARDAYKDLRTFVSNARRDTGRLARALARDFEKAEKRLAGSSAAGTPRRGSAARTARSRSTSRRTGGTSK